MGNLSKRTCALLFGLFLWAGGTVRADTTVKRLAPGVTLTQEIDRKTPLIINVVSVDLTAPGVRLGVGIGQDKITGTDGAHGREDVSRLARRWGAVAAVNADFFPYTGDPLGVGIRDGELFSEPFPGHSRQGGPRVTLGLMPRTARAFCLSTLGFTGRLAGGGRPARRISTALTGRSAGMRSLSFSAVSTALSQANKPGGVEVVVTRGKPAGSRQQAADGARRRAFASCTADTEAIPDVTVWCCPAGREPGADFLARNLHPGDPGQLRAGGGAGRSRRGGRVSESPPCRAPGGICRHGPGAGLSRSAWEWAHGAAGCRRRPAPAWSDGQVAVDWAAEGL